MLLVLIRAVFILVIAGFGVRTAQIVSENQLANPYILFVAVMLAAVAIVIGDWLTPRKKIQTISAVYIGLIVGVVLTYLLQSPSAGNDSLSGSTGPPDVLIVYLHIYMLCMCFDTFADQG